MPLRVVASRPDPALLPLPWSKPLADWDEVHLVPLPQGLSRHVVRIITTGPGGNTYVAKETEEEIAHREYRMLRELRSRNLPSVEPLGVVTGRTSDDGTPLPSVLITRHLRFSLPYRWLFSHGLGATDLPAIIDAMVVLLVRLHLANFFWGDVSLSNVLFRRNAGEFAAYLVDAETGELKSTLSEAMREHDVTVGCENVYAELLDLTASGDLKESVDPGEVIGLLQERYDALWDELTGAEEFDREEMWHVEQRIERLNELGFDVDEIEMVGTPTGDRYLLQPKVVELGHHARELAGLTGLHVEENQARRLLNDLAAFTAHFGLGEEDPEVVANRWLVKVYEPIKAMVPPEMRGRLEPAELFHEVLVHRWFLSEAAGHEIDIFDTARDFIATQLPHRPPMPSG
ncbi:lipopolysaccharide kinase [Nocardioides sp. Soil797]|nr:lipopolysaccharide kinase [Nocardioides sp. Soil797]